MIRESFGGEEKRVPFGLLLLFSFALFNLGFIVTETIRWSDHTAGFMNGVFHVLFFGIGWCIFFLPWSIAVTLLCRWCNWRRFQTHWILAPSVLVFIVLVGDIVLRPPTPSRRFKSFAGTELPANVQNLQHYFSGGGIADFQDEYFFQTTPTEVRRLISAMHLTEGGSYLNAAEIEGSYLSRNPIFPVSAFSKDSRVFARNNRETGWYYELRTNSTYTMAFITIGCI